MQVPQTEIPATIFQFFIGIEIELLDKILQK